MSIRISKLTKAFAGNPVVTGLDLTLPERGIVAIAGPSGCGKTTLLHLLAGLLVPDAGSIIGESRGMVSMVFQEDRLLPWLSALENVALVAASQDAAAKWLKRMQLAPYAAYYPEAMSGGMRRRVALARALAFKSGILLLDEPFQGLDAELKKLVYEQIREAGKSRLIVLVTHDAADILQLADSILQASGPPLNLHPVTREQFAAGVGSQ